MNGDIASLAAEMAPYLSAAAGAYGGAVLAKVRDEAADATVGLGRRLLLRIFGTRGEKESLPEPVEALVKNPEDSDVLAAMRLAIRKALSSDPALESEVRAMLAGAQGVIQQGHTNVNANNADRDQIIINNFASSAKRVVSPASTSSWNRST